MLDVEVRKLASIQSPSYSLSRRVSEQMTLVSIGHKVVPESASLTPPTQIPAREHDLHQVKFSFIQQPLSPAQYKCHLSCTAQPIGQHLWKPVLDEMLS